MAIKIPSKNIYEINNPKVRDNVVDNVSVEQTVVKNNNEYETPVYQYEGQEFNVGELQTRARIKYSTFFTGGNIGQSYYALSASLVQLQTNYTKSINIEIPKLLKTGYISKIYEGKNFNGENNIKFTVYQKVTKQDVYMDITIPNNIQNNGEQDFSPSNIVISSTLVSNNTISNNETNIEATQSTSASIGNADASISNSLSEINEENISSIKFFDNADDTHFIANGLIVLVGKVITKMSYEYTSGGVAGVPPLSPIRLKGTKETYTPERIEITIYGDTIGIDLSDGSVSYIKNENEKIVEGKGNKPFSLNGNELLQDSGKVGDNAITQNLAKNILGQYEKGKETATLLCSMSDYYDESGELIISTKSNNLLRTPYTGRANNNGIQFTENKDGSVTLNGYNNGNFNSAYFIYLPEDKAIFKAGTYCFSGNLGNNVYLNAYYNGMYHWFRYNTFEIFKEDTWIEQLYIIVDAGTNTVYNDYTVYPMANIGKILKPFEPYKKMCFDLNDEVIPYVYGSDGQDRPMSKYQDGSPKGFEVTGSNIFYDGAVWQELTLLEKIQDNT